MTDTRKKYQVAFTDTHRHVDVVEATNETDAWKLARERHRSGGVLALETARVVAEQDEAGNWGWLIP